MYVHMCVYMTLCVCVSEHVCVCVCAYIPPLLSPKMAIGYWPQTHEHTLLLALGANYLCG